MWTLNQIARLSVVIALPAFLVGCESFNMKKEFPWAKDDEIPEKRVTKLVSSWSETALAKPGKLPQRGFGGRLYFFDIEDKAILADGELVIYGYDNPAGMAFDGPPDRRFVFTSEQLASHYSDSSVGPSYSVWVPWDQIDGDQKFVDLVPTFVPKLGQVVVGSQCRMRLPGRQTSTMMDQPPNTGQDQRSLSAATIAPVDYHQSVNTFGAANVRTTSPLAGPPQSTTETTLRMPPSIQKRMRMTASAAQTRQSQPSTSQHFDNSIERLNAYQEAMATIGAANAAGARETQDARERSPSWGGQQAVEAPVPPAMQSSGHFAPTRPPGPTAPSAQQPNDPPVFGQFQSKRPQFPAPFQSWTHSKAPPRFGAAATSVNVPRSR